MGKKIGVSYNSKNKEQLNKIESILCSIGIKIIRYDTHLKVKDDIYQFMNAMTEMDMNLLLLSKEYFSSPFCLYELSKLVEQPEKTIVIYLEENVQIEELINDVQDNLRLSYTNQFSWLSAELKKIRFTDVMNLLVGMLSEKYLSFNEIISINGVKQILTYLNYTPDSYISELDKILEKTDFYEREKCFVEYLEFAPANEIYNYYKALSYEKQGYVQGAFFYLKQSIDINKTYIIAYTKLLDLSLKYPEKVSFDEEVFTYLEKQSDLSLQDRINVWKAKGMFLFRKAKKEDSLQQIRVMHQALECFEQADKLSDNQDATIYNNMGLAYEVLGEIDAALNAYQRAIQINSNYYQALNNLALLYDKYLGKVDISRSMYERCLDINPNYSIAQSNYALLMEKIDINVALEMDLRMLCKPHEFTNFITNLALILEEEKISPKVAGILYKIILEKNPQSPSAMFNMGNFLRRNRGAYADVYKYLMSVYEVMPCSDMVLLSLALLELQEDHIEFSLDFCDKAIQCNERYIPAFFLRGYLNEKMGLERSRIIIEIKDTIKTLEKNENIERHQYALLYNLISILLFKEGEMELAQKWHTLAFELNCNLKEELHAEELDYGFDILEYEYTHFSDGRINKYRIENIALDNHKETVSYLLNLIDATNNDY